LRTTSTWPLDFFRQDWDDKGYLHASKDTKAWWSIQKLTCFHFLHRKTFDEANIKPNPNAEDATMDLKDNDKENNNNSHPPSILSRNKCKFHNENQMDTKSGHTSMPTTKTATEKENTTMQDAPVNTPKPTSNSKIMANAWTMVGAGGKPAQPTKKKFTLPIKQRIKEVCQTKITGSRTKHNTYFEITLTLTLPPHKKCQKKFLSILKDLWKNLKELDESATWLTYRNENCDGLTMVPISKTSQFPKTFMAAQKYLRSLSGINKTGRNVFTTIIIGHNLPSKEIQDCMRGWANADDHFFFE
jgi:hypothetical protein